MANYQLKFGPESKRVIGRLVDATKKNEETLFRDAITLYDVVYQEIQQKNHRLCVVNQEDEIIKEITLS